jgi:hypothetical protein
MRPQSECYFCHGPSESRTSSGFAACRKCIRKTLLPFISEALGPEELRRAITDDQDRAAAPSKMDRLLTGARRAGTPALLPAGELSRGLGQPPRRRQMTASEQKLALQRAVARQAGAVIESDIAREVRRAGLRA